MVYNKNASSSQPLIDGVIVLPALSTPNIITPIDFEENDTILIDYTTEEVVSVIRDGKVIWVKDEWLDNA